MATLSTIEGVGGNRTIPATSSASTHSSPPHGLDDETLYTLAGSVEHNPQLLPEADRSYRLEGIFVSLDLDHRRFESEVLNPSLTAHSALCSALLLAKDKLVASGLPDCSLRLTSALSFAGLYELSDIYKELCREPVFV